MNENLQEIKTTLEKIRFQKFPEVSPEIISLIVDIQFSHQEDRVNGRMLTHREIKRYIDEEVNINVEV